MLAQVLVRNSTPQNSFELREVPIPGLKEGEVRIKVSAFGLNYADILARQGLYRECPPLPCIVGYEIEGEIDAVSPGITEFKIGDRVFAMTRFGGYAQFVCTPVEVVSHLTLGVPVGVGCALSVHYVTAFHAAVHCQTLMPGEKVLIHSAAGGLGTALIQLALWKGCIVLGIAGGSEKSEYLKTLGVQHIVDHHKISYFDYISDHLDGKVDVIFDNLGGSSVKKAKSVLAKGGRIVTLGAASISGKKGIVNLLRLVVGFGVFSPIGYLSKSQSLIGVNMLKIADFRRDIIAVEFSQVQRLHQEGILKPYIGKIFNYSQIADAHEWMEKRKSIGKIVVTWD